MRAARLLAKGLSQSEVARRVGAHRQSVSRRDDTPTFAFLLMGTIMIIGAMLFLPVAALGPVAEHLGPLPFGG